MSGFELLISEALAANARNDRFAAPQVLVVGSGGTARAALVALERLNISPVVASRSAEKGGALARSFGARFSELSGVTGDFALIIDTLPSSAGVELPIALTINSTVITADYSGAVRPVEASRRIDGLQLLAAQAAAQSQLFCALSAERDQSKEQEQ